MEDERLVERDRQRAEVFEALGRPTRIFILKVLSEGCLGFADLRKKTGIESGGHLQPHLTKLNGLIKTDEYGKYCLSYEGKDALLTVQTVENASPEKEAKEKAHRHFKVGLKPVAFLLMALLIASSAIAVYEYNQTANLQKETNFLASANPQAAAYYNEFGAIPSSIVNASFTPPVSMYRALQIGLEYQGWDKASLRGKLVGADLVRLEMLTNTSGVYPPFGLVAGLDLVTSPPENYSNTYGNGVVYGYAWEITVEKASRIPGVPPLGFSLVDATTGQILPNPPFG